VPLLSDKAGRLSINWEGAFGVTVLRGLVYDLGWFYAGVVFCIFAGVCLAGSAELGCGGGARDGWGWWSGWAVAGGCVACAVLGGGPQRGVLAGWTLSGLVVGVSRVICYVLTWLLHVDFFDCVAHCAWRVFGGEGGGVLLPGLGHWLAGKGVGDAELF
ncbi:hypothetical protein Tco_0932514, partial [Tanacetum coccineum]